MIPIIINDLKISLDQLIYIIETYEASIKILDTSSVLGVGCGGSAANSSYRSLPSASTSRSNNNQGALYVLLAMIPTKIQFMIDMPVPQVLS